jgi:hypothetical protein
MATQKYINPEVLKIFPWTAANGKVIVDEKCGCGHMRSKHYDRFMPGHGHCSDTDCDCPQFTWVKTVFESKRKRSIPGPNPPTKEK